MLTFSGHDVRVPLAVEENVCRVTGDLPLSVRPNYWRQSHLSDTVGGRGGGGGGGTWQGEGKADRHKCEVQSSLVYLQCMYSTVQYCM